MTTRRPSAEEGDFLGRWSRLKRERASEETAAAEPAPAPEEARADTPPEDVKTDEQVLEELGLPHPDTLRPGDDFSAFMAKAVPEHLRRIALRKLWGSNPVLACLDGLNDYEDDYTDAALAVKTLATNYKVGRGFRPLEDEATTASPAASPAPQPAPQPAPTAAEVPGAEDAGDDRAAAAAGDAVPGTADSPLAATDAAGGAAEGAAPDATPAPGMLARDGAGEAVPAAAGAGDPSPERADEPASQPILTRRGRMRFHQAD